MRFRNLFTPFCIVAVFLVSCTNSRTRFYDASVDNDTLQIKVERFDLDLFTLDTASLAAKYGDFLKIDDTLSRECLHRIEHTPTLQWNDIHRNASSRMNH